MVPTCGLLLLLAAGGAWWLRGQLRASLPRLDGTLALRGLSAPVSIDRDTRGIPTVRGATREDVARATGFVHAQDRFFQMDLSRRRAAGELAALVGPRAVPLDRATRIHRFRAQAERVVATLPAADRRVLDAYVAGVNSGLSSLGARPFEYLLLRQRPRPWRAADSILVVCSMFLVLQEGDGGYESMQATMGGVLPPEMVAWLSPRGTEWDTPIDGAMFSVPPVPGRDVYDLRARRATAPTPDIPRPAEVVLADPFARESEAGETALGSNNWAVAGSLTADGHALLANDMHLMVRVPNTWYRASIEWGVGGERTRLSGVTLPGVPALVAGSNGHVAWGFTNTYADWSDVVLLEVNADDASQYRTPGGWRRFDVFDETIDVAGASAVHERVAWTIWGPVLSPDYRGRARALRWAAHEADAVRWTVTPLESARTLGEAFDAANGLGTPGQNMVAVDRDGHIGWSIYGAMPRRRGFDGRLPMSWADGLRGWDGWLDTAEYPRVVDPPGGRLWTANARVVGGEALTRLGDGGYEIGSRARAIRDRLASLDKASARQMLDVQLDTRAGFLSRWRDLLLRTLTPDAVGAHPDRARFRQIVERDWDGTVGPDSVAYRLVRAFREQASERVIAFVLAECYEADPTFTYRAERRREGPIWKLVTEQPMHLLDPAFASWDALLVAAVDTTIAQASRSGDLAGSRWADYNVTAYRHPLSGAVPFIGRWLDMPPVSLPGDLYTPRVHWGAVAASVRMVVSPGREADGIMHMPTGQSGHPLSPFYANSHLAWLAGEPTPFLPGPAVHSLTLVP